VAALFGRATGIFSEEPASVRHELERFFCGALDVTLSLPEDTYGPVSMGGAGGPKDLVRSITRNRAVTTVKLICGADSFKQSHFNGMMESLSQYEAHHKPTGNVVSLDIFLHMLVQEWEQYRGHCLEAIQTALLSTKHTQALQLTSLLSMTDVAKVVRRLQPQLSEAQVTAIYGEALDRSNSDVEVSSNALMTIIHQYRLLPGMKAAENTEAIPKFEGSRMALPPKLDTALVEFMLEGCIEWLRADAAELLDSQEGRDSAAGRVLDLSVEETFAQEAALSRDARGGDSSRLIGHLLQRARQQIERVKQKNDTRGAWKALEQLVRFWL
jgi:hypothetical protein